MSDVSGNQNGFCRSLLDSIGKRRGIVIRQYVMLWRHPSDYELEYGLFLVGSINLQVSSKLILLQNMCTYCRRISIVSYSKTKTVRLNVLTWEIQLNLRETQKKWSIYLRTVGSVPSSLSTSSPSCSFLFITVADFHTALVVAPGLQPFPVCKRYFVLRVILYSVRPFYSWPLCCNYRDE